MFSAINCCRMSLLNWPAHYSCLPAARLEVCPCFPFFVVCFLHFTWLTANTLLLLLLAIILCGVCFGMPPFLFIHELVKGVVSAIHFCCCCCCCCGRWWRPCAVHFNFVVIIFVAFQLISWQGKRVRKVESNVRKIGHYIFRKCFYCE